MGNVFESGMTECQKAWDLLRKTPEYRKDYNKQKDSTKAQKGSKSMEACLWERWGFFPLDSPCNKKPSFQFSCYFESSLGKSALQEQAIGVGELEFFPNDKNRPVCTPGDGEHETFRNKIKVDINLSAPDNIILGQIKKLLMRTRKSYKIDRKSTVKYDAETFIVGMLKKIGYSNRKIEDFLTPEEHRGESYLDSPRESYRKKAYRRIKKF